MADWLVEEGIGEHRAIRVDDGNIVQARLAWLGEPMAGTVVNGVLVAKSAGARRGIARLPTGEEALVDNLPAQASEGATIRLRITRAPLAERGRFKLAQTRPTDEATRSSFTLADRLRHEGHHVRIVHRFSACDWDELMAEAFAAEIGFAGGSLLFSATPAMMLVDVDGALPPRDLALAAVPAIAEAILRFDLGGSIGIDFPTLPAKTDRQAVDTLLKDCLVTWPHERTAMNGFGFVQIVARMEGPSLLHRAAFQRVGIAIRQLLRRAERLEGPGTIELAGHPALERALRPDWIADLAARTGRTVHWRTDPGLALVTPHAQLVQR